MDKDRSLRRDLGWSIGSWVPLVAYFVTSGQPDLAVGAALGISVPIGLALALRDRTR